MTDEDVPLSVVRKRIRQTQNKFPPPPKDYTYKFLREIYRMRSEFGEPMPANVQALLQAEHATMHHKVQKEYYRVLIELTADWIDPRLKSRYCNALLFALKSRVKAKDLISFMKSQGGINACDKKYRRMRSVKAHAE